MEYWMILVSLSWASIYIGCIEKVLEKIESDKELWRISTKCQFASRIDRGTLDRISSYFNQVLYAVFLINTHTHDGYFWDINGKTALHKRFIFNFDIMMRSINVIGDKILSFRVIMSVCIQLESMKRDRKVKFLHTKKCHLSLFFHFRIFWHLCHF